MRARIADYVRGYLDGLDQAAKRVLCAPLLCHGQRRADVPGGFPRVLDNAVDPDGDPNFVYCDYALRDAILFWLKEDAARYDGSGEA